jgi:neutral ceramidase
MTSLRVGRAAYPLEVARGSSMAGYVARSGAVEGALHPLEVAAVAFVGSGRTAVVCVADLLHVDDEVAYAVRAAVAEAVGTAADLVWLCATHTHSGPEPREVADQLGSHAVAAARDAIAGAVDAAVSLHRAELAGVGGQRTGSARRATVPVDILGVADPSGSLVGVLGVLPVHPTVLGAGNTLVSPDLHGAVRRSLAADGIWSVVATGAAGDVSTRAHRREQTPAEVDRLGALAAAAMLSAVATPSIGVASDVVGGWVESVGLPPGLVDAPFRRGALDAAQRGLKEAESAGDAVRIREATVVLEGVELAASYVPAGPVPCATAYLDLGGIRLVGLGGEPFLDLAPGATTVLVGYANGYAGYLPTRDAFAEASADPDHPAYEVLISRVAPGSPERALAVALNG